MALQVRPGSAEPAIDTELNELAKVIRTRPADSIRASDQVSHKQAGCMAATSTRNSAPENCAWQNGASMYDNLRMTQP